MDADTRGLAAALSSLGIYMYVVTDLIEMVRSTVCCLSRVACRELLVIEPEFRRIFVEGYHV